jgi:hypothetical protein
MNFRVKPFFCNDIFAVKANNDLLVKLTLGIKQRIAKFFVSGGFFRFAHWL